MMQVGGNDSLVYPHVPIQEFFFLTLLQRNDSASLHLLENSRRSMAGLVIPQYGLFVNTEVVPQNWTGS